MLLFVCSPIYCTLFSSFGLSSSLIKCEFKRSKHSDESFHAVQIDNHFKSEIDSALPTCWTVTYAFEWLCLNNIPSGRDVIIPE